jgi:TrmH family RNA methyltransferase
VIITSRDNSLVKHLRSLRLREHRQSERAFLVEGARAVADALDAGGTLRWLVVRDGDGAILGGVPPERLRVLDRKVFDGLAQTETPQGVLGVFEMPSLPIPQRLNPLFVVLDAISDPGNMGTIIRTCAAAGVDALFLWPDCVDPFNPKVVRSAMGAHFRIPIHVKGKDDETFIESATGQRVVSDGQARERYDALDWTKPSTLIVGSEAHGVSREAAALATTSASIPMAAGVESLNAAVAAAVFLFEAQRQRRASD